MRPRRVLGSAAMLTLAAALFQVVICAVPSWSRYFGAPEQLLARPALLIATGVGVAIVLAAAYAASGAGYLRRLPRLHYVLLAIGTLFTLRGLIVVPLAMAELGLTERVEGAPSGGLVSSAFALTLGILFLAGTLPRWRSSAEATGVPVPGRASPPATGPSHNQGRRSLSNNDLRHPWSR